MSFVSIRSYPQLLSAGGQCYELVRHFEQFRARVYDAGDGLDTIGFGHVIKAHEGWLKQSPIGIDVGTALLASDIAAMEVAVRQLVTTPITQSEFDALVSFAFNVGPDMDHDGRAEGLGDSTLLRLLNAGDREGAAGEFGKWVMCRGVKLAGLVRRRAAERALFIGDDWRVFTRDDWAEHVA